MAMLHMFTVLACKYNLCVLYYGLLLFHLSNTDGYKHDLE